MCLHDLKEQFYVFCLSKIYEFFGANVGCEIWWTNRHPGPFLCQFFLISVVVSLQADVVEFVQEPSPKPSPKLEHRNVTEGQRNGMEGESSVGSRKPPITGCHFVHMHCYWKCLSEHLLFEKCRLGRFGGEMTDFIWVDMNWKCSWNW